MLNHLTNFFQIFTLPTISASAGSIGVWYFQGFGYCLLGGWTISILYAAYIKCFYKYDSQTRHWKTVFNVTFNLLITGFTFLFIDILCKSSSFETIIFPSVASGIFILAITEVLLARKRKVLIKYKKVNNRQFYIDIFDQAGIPEMSEPDQPTPPIVAKLSQEGLKVLPPAQVPIFLVSVTC